MSKRAKSEEGAVGGDALSWKEVLPKIQNASKEQLIGCLADSWGSMRSDARLNFLAMAERATAVEQERRQNNWLRVDDLTMILEFDWATKGGGSTMDFRSHIASGGEEDSMIELKGCDFCMEIDLNEFKQMLKTGKIDLVSDGFEQDGCGCEECGAVGSYLEMRLEKKGDDYRLVTTSHIFCGCNSYYGEPDDCGGGDEIYYPVTSR